MREPKTVCLCTVDVSQGPDEFQPTYSMVRCDENNDCAECDCEACTHDFPTRQWDRCDSPECGVESWCHCPRGVWRQVQPIHLERDEDVSGVSGTGIVAFGALFPDGSVVLRWDTKVRSTVMYDSLIDMQMITSHGGKTRVVFDS